MLCKKCGNEIDNNARFCESCGASVDTKSPTDKAVPELTVGGDIKLCEDGVYRWVYEYSLLKNPGIFFLIFKVFFFIILGIFAFVSILDIIGGNMSGEHFLNMLKIFGIMLLVMTGLVAVSYLVYAGLMGGKYIVVFEMDEKGINHKQIEKQAEKARRIGSAAAFAGASAGSFSVAGAGRNVRTEMYSPFDSVRKIKPCQKRELIKVNGLFQHNQVFVRAADLDFVLGYINNHVPERAKLNK